MASKFTPAPTYADPVVIDDRTKKSQFNPIWLKWFLDLTAYISANSGGTSTIQHNATQGLQGGNTGEYYHFTAAEHTTLLALIAPTLYYGAFQDNSTQSHTVINTPKGITFGTTDFANGFNRGTPTSRIVAAHAGFYNFEFSLQMTKSSSNLGYAYIWPRINGTDVPDSNSRIAFQGANSDTIPAWNFGLQMAAGDYFELMWAVSDTGITMPFIGSTPVGPNIPSVILTVTSMNF